MRRHTTGFTLLFVAITCFSHRGEAQGSATATAPIPLPATDSIFRRARRLVSDGNGAAGRALVDSVLRASGEGTIAYGDAIFWRGALAETAADAERDYRRVIVEYPLSSYADDALLSLAELEQARGDRTAAYQHLQRFVREHPVSAARARAGLAAARLAFEQRDLKSGCAMIADARMSAGTSDVELRNQIEYYGGRCSTVTSSAPVTPATPTPSSNASATVPVHATSVPTSSASPRSPATSPARKSDKAVVTPPARDSARPAPSETTPGRTPRTTAPASPAAESSRGSWTIQLAAFNTHAEAERLVAKLAGRGVKARISGDAKPFRVRLDFYPTRDAAATVVTQLKQRGIIGFVTEEARPRGARTP